MGSFNSKLRNECGRQKFVGRREKLEDAKTIVNTNKVIAIFGTKGVGKSRFLCKLAGTLQDPISSMFYENFELYTPDDVKDEYKLLEKSYREFGSEDDLKDFRERFPNGTTECGKCENCSKNKRDQCLVLRDKEKKSLVNCLNDKKKVIYFLLDNIDPLISTERSKSIFLDFIRCFVTHCTSIKIILTSCRRIKFQDHFQDIKLGVLDIHDSLELLHELVEQNQEQESDSLERLECDAKYFKVGSRVFKPENQELIETIAKLCEGLPVALQTSGSLLADDDGLFNPADVVQLLIISRIKLLSPECVPPCDRIDDYQNEFNKLQEKFSTYLYTLSENMEDDSCSIEKATATSQGSKAQTKMNLIQPLINRSLLSHRGGEIHIHSVLKECLVLMRYADDTSSPEEAKKWTEQCIRNNAQRTSLDIPEECLTDAKKLEAFIESRCPAPTQDVPEVIAEIGRLSTSSSSDRIPSSAGPMALSYQGSSQTETGTGTFGDSDFEVRGPPALYVRGDQFNDICPTPGDDVEGNLVLQPSDRENGNLEALALKVNDEQHHQQSQHKGFGHNGKQIASTDYFSETIWGDQRMTKTRQAGVGTNSDNAPCVESERLENLKGVNGLMNSRLQQHSGDCMTEKGKPVSQPSD